jgi:hypothetical protein
MHETNKYMCITCRLWNVDVEIFPTSMAQTFHQYRKEILWKIHTIKTGKTDNKKKLK